MKYFVYIIYSDSFDKFYIGQTQDFQARIKRHNQGLEEATKPFKPYILKFLIEENI